MLNNKPVIRCNRSVRQATSAIIIKRKPMSQTVLRLFKKQCSTSTAIKNSFPFVPQNGIIFVDHRSLQLVCCKLYGWSRNNETLPFFV